MIRSIAGLGLGVYSTGSFDRERKVSSSERREKVNIVASSTKLGYMFIFAFAKSLLNKVLPNVL